MPSLEEQRKFEADLEEFLRGNEEMNILDLGEFINEWVEEEEKEHKEQEEKKRKLQNPFQTNHIIIHPVSTASVQKVTSLQAAQKRSALKVHFKKLKCQVKKMSMFSANRVIYTRAI